MMCWNPNPLQMANSMASAGTTARIELNVKAEAFSCNFSLRKQRIDRFKVLSMWICNLYSVMCQISTETNCQNHFTHELMRAKNEGFFLRFAMRLYCPDRFYK